MRTTILRVLAAYYVATGVWPLAHMPSFEAVTGRKTDRWLVRMVGALAVANGLSLAVGARRKAPETVTLALLSAAAFTTVDIVYVAARRIRPIYLADAAVEAGFALALCLSK